MQASHPSADRESRAKEVRSTTSIPLCIDLDGTLLMTDLLWEETLALIKKNPRALLSIPLWLLAGRAQLKRRIAQASQLDVTALPYRSEVLELIRAARQEGRRIVLVSAAEESEAERIAAHLGCFDEVIGSNGSTNMKGKVKRATLVERFGEKGFDYAGDHAADIYVWEAARAAYVVSHSRRLNRRAQAVATVEPMTMAAARSTRIWLGAMRPHQWSKNVLIAVPILTSHKLDDPRVLLGGAIAFVAFCLISSSTYLVNDLIDLEADRRHRTKRNRAFSSGTASLSRGVALAIVLCFCGFALGATVGFNFLAVLAAYYATTFCYSAFLKRIAILDVLVLAGLYTLRIFAGGAATNITVSLWLLAFSMFFFFSLALVKRYSELHLELGRPEIQIGGRGYRATDLPQVAMFGIASGFVAVLVLVLYVRSPEVTLLYRKPSLLLAICPLLLYWLSRVWMFAARGEMHEDPVVFALTDRVSYGLGILAAAAVYFSTV